MFITFVRSMGLRRGVMAWWRLIGLRAESHFAQHESRVHHGERPKLPGWRR